MSLSAVYVKEERDETTECILNDDASVKLEPGVIDELMNEKPECSERSDTSELYFEHEVKDELVLGPECLQPADAVFTLRSELYRLPRAPTRSVTLEHVRLASPGPVKVTSPAHTCPAAFRHRSTLAYHLSKHSELTKSEDSFIQNGRTIDSDSLIPNRRTMDTMLNHVCIQSKSEPIPNQTTTQTTFKSDSGKTVENIPNDGEFFESASVNSSRESLENKLLIQRNFVTCLYKNAKIYEYECDSCGEKFNNKLSLIHHIKCHSVPGKKYSCRLCKKKFKSFCYLRKHRWIHAPKRYSCEDCGQMFSQSGNLKRHSLTHTEGKHACKVCGKMFALSYLKSHERTHKGEKQYFCGTCDRRFMDNSSLSKHRRIHLSVRPYGCDVCEKRFSDLRNLNRHKRIHLKIKPYECGLCKKKFSESSALTIHERTHTGLKPFSCGICNKQFSQLGQKTRHERTHTGEKPYICAICDKGFSQLNSLKSHKLIHDAIKPYYCEICNKNFTELSNLKVHMLIHTGVMRFSCVICEKLFSQLGNLKRHERTHTGEKPYFCIVCEKRFSDLCSLNCHKLTQHAAGKSTVDTSES